MKIKRIDLEAGDTSSFSYEGGDRYVYISRGKHPELKFGKPVKLSEGQVFEVTTEAPIQVSCMYE